MKKATSAAARWRATDFGINNQQTLLAMKGPTGVGLMRLSGTDQTITPLDSRTGLLAPVIDPQGFIWSLGAAKDSALQAFDTKGGLKFSTLSWLESGTHRAFAISREGGRLAVLLVSTAGSRLLIAAIERDEDGVPIGISQPIEIGNTQNIVRSLAWIDDTSVATIAMTDEGYTYPLYLEVGGETKKFAPVANATSVVANSSYSSAYVLDSVRQLRVLRSMTWVDFATDVLAIHFAG
jgi:hypothetical protein